MVIREYAGVGFYDSESNELMLYVNTHAHYIIYKPVIDAQVNVSTMHTWDIHDILEGDCSIERVRDRCREILEEIIAKKSSASLKKPE